MAARLNLQMCPVPYQAMGADGSPVSFSLPARGMLGRSAKRGRSTTMIRKHFRLKRIALGLALATAVVAPTAQAAVYVDGPTPGVQAGYIQAAAHQPIASEMSVQSPVSQIKVEGMRWQAMAKQYENMPGITAAGAALANQKH